jgi:hypothetical protein
MNKISIQITMGVKDNLMTFISLLIWLSSRQVHFKFHNKLKFNFPPPFHTPHLATLQILGYDNGFLCIIGGIANIGTSTILLNPATQDVKVLLSRGELLSMIATKTTFHGFGYDHVRDDYKTHPICECCGG